MNKEYQIPPENFIGLEEILNNMASRIDLLRKNQEFIMDHLKKGVMNEKSNKKRKNPFWY